MKHTKKLLSLLLVLVMVLGMLPGPVLAVGEDDPAGTAGYATVEDLNAAFEAVGETDDVDAALAALDAYLAVYDRLSDEDKAANAEAVASAQAYRENLVAGKEAGEDGEEYEDPEIELLYGPFNSVPLSLPIKCPGLTGSYSNVVYTWMQYISRSEACGSNTNASYSANVRFVDNGTNYVMVVDVKVGNWSTSTTTNYTVPKSTHDAKAASGSVTGSLSFNTQGGNTSPITVYGGHAHKFTVQGAWKTAPDCIHDGVAYFTCSNCSESTTKTVTGSKLGHSFPTTWNDGCTSHEDAGCTQHSHVCTRCYGNLSGGTETANHTYPTQWTVVTPATTTSKGREKKVCTACGHTIYQDIDKVEEPTTTADYTVNWYDTDGNVLKAPETRKGTVDETVSATDEDKNLSAAGYIYLPDQSTSSAKLAASGTELKLYFTKNVKTKTIPVTPVVHFRVEGENATQLTKEQIAQNYSITFTYTDEDGEQTQTLTPSTDGATWGTTDSGTLSLTWNDAFNVKIKEVDGRVDLAIAQGAYTVGEVNYVKTKTPNKSDSRDGSGAVHTTSSAYTVKFWVTNYYELPKATVTWFDEDGLTKLDGPKTFNKGDTEPTTSVIPTKAEDENYTYTFKEWVKMADSTEDAIKYKATYTATPKGPVNPDPTPTEYTVTVKYVDENGNVIAGYPSVTVNTTEGGKYDVNDKKIAIDGYTYQGADKDLSGKVTGNITITLTYKKDTVTPEPEKVTVTFKDGYDNTEIPDSKITDWTKGEEVPEDRYPTVPVHEDKDFDGWEVETAGDGNITITAKWKDKTVKPGPDPEPEPEEPTPVYYTLTINYVDAEGNVVAPRHRESLESGTQYSVASPDVEGMTPDQAVVSGRLTRNTTVTVRYTADEEIEEPDIPLVETPEPTGTPEPTEEPEEDLGDEDTPLAELPDEPNEPDEEDLADVDTPLANVPQTGDHLWFWALLTLCSAAGLFCFFPRKKGKREV